MGQHSVDYLEKLRKGFSTQNENVRFAIPATILSIGLFNRIRSVTLYRAGRGSSVQLSCAGRFSTFL